MSGGDFLIGIKNLVGELESLRTETIALKATNRKQEQRLGEQEVQLQDRERLLKDQNIDLEYKDLIIKQSQAYLTVKDQGLSEAASQIKRLEKENKSLGKRDRVFKRMAEQRNRQRLVDIKAVEPYKVGDVLIVRIDGELHYASVQKINSATLTVKRETGGWFRISPSKIEKIFYANDQIEHEDEEYQSSSSEEEDNEEMEDEDREDEDPFSSEPSDCSKRAREQEEEDEEGETYQKRLRGQVEEGVEEESFSDGSDSSYSCSN